MQEHTVKLDLLYIFYIYICYIVMAIFQLQLWAHKTIIIALTIVTGIKKWRLSNSVVNPRIRSVGVQYFTSSCRSKHQKCPTWRRLSLTSSFCFLDRIRFYFTIYVYKLTTLCIMRHRQLMNRVRVKNKTELVTLISAATELSVLWWFFMGYYEWSGLKDEFEVGNAFFNDTQHFVTEIKD
jgi:hypothetical protein